MNKFYKMRRFIAGLLFTVKNKGKPKLGRPKTNFKVINKTSEIGTKAGETRATFIINEESLESLKALAYWERLTIKDVLSQAIEAFNAQAQPNLKV